jgi:hypothetical protein
MSTRPFLVLAIVLTSAPVAAQGNFRATPTGGRSALMGGTGVALGTDGASVFLNPATLMQTDWQLSASVNLVSGEYQIVHRYVAPGPVDPNFGPKDTTITKMAFDVLPTTVCLFTTGPKLIRATTDRGHTKLGLCFGSLEHDKFEFVGHGYLGGTDPATQALQSTVRTWQRFILAPTAAILLTPTVALGASINANFSNIGGVASMSSITNGSATPTMISNYDNAFHGDAFGLSTTIGLTVRQRRWLFGFAAGSSDWTFYGTSQISSSTISSGATTYASTYSGSGTFRPQAPWRLSAGASRQWQWGSAELDVSVGIPHDVAFQLNSTGTETVSTDGVVVTRPSSVNLTERPSGVLQAALGTEWYLSPQFSLLGGISGSFTLNPVLTGVLPTRQQRAGVSLGVGSHGQGGDLVFGLDVSYARGQTIATNGYVFPPRLEAVDMEGVRIIFILAGSTSLQTLARGVKDMIGTPATRQEERVKENKDPKSNPNAP